MEKSLKDCRQLCAVSWVTPHLLVGSVTQDVPRSACSLKHGLQESGGVGALLKPAQEMKICCIPVCKGLLVRGVVTTV